MIDIHTHILPGLDDGAQTLKDSVRMARMASDCGVVTMFATPHSNIEGLYDNYYSDDFLDNFKLLEEELDKEQIPIKILPGMEVYGTEDVPYLLHQGAIVTMNNSRYLLLEFGFHKDALLIDYLIDELTDQGICPIIAHPERYPYVQKNPNIIPGWLDRGCFIQINKGSIAGGFGCKARDTVQFLLNHYLVSFVASDTHGPDVRTPDLTFAYDYICTNHSKEYAEILFKENPGNVIEDKELIRIHNNNKRKRTFII